MSELVCFIVSFSFTYTCDSLFFREVLTRYQSSLNRSLVYKLRSDYQYVSSRTRKRVLQHSESYALMRYLQGTHRSAPVNDHAAIIKIRVCNSPKHLMVHCRNAPHFYFKIHELCLFFYLIFLHICCTLFLNFCSLTIKQTTSQN